MRHTLDEASMLEILAAAESDTRPRAGPHSPEMSAGRRAYKTRPPSQPRVGGEQEPAPDANSLQTVGSADVGSNPAAATTSANGP